MTSYTLTAPSSRPVTPPNTQGKDTAREARENRKNSDDYYNKSPDKADKSEKADRSGNSKISEKSTLTENRSEIANTDSSLFAELMASLLNMPAPAQPQQTITVKAVANDGRTPAFDTASDNVVPFSTFSMDPALLVIPQDMAAATLTTSSDGSFSAELFAALTPGTPAPLENTSGDTAPAVIVPVPVATGNTTDSLTVSADTDADPRMVACGFNPYDMGKFKDLILKHTDVNKSNMPQPVQNEDGGVITVTFTPEKTVTPSSNVAVVVATQTTAGKEAFTTPDIADDIYVAQTLDADAGEIKTSVKTNIGETATSETANSEESFDPVEFRIAQSFQRPVTKPAASQAPVAQPTATPDNSTGYNTNANVSQHHNAGNTAKMTSNADIAASLPSSVLPANATSPDLVTANPVAIPLTVTAIAASPVAQNITASQSHPAVQTVAAVIAKNVKDGGPQTINLRLDPPELGKLQVQMKYKKGDPLRVHVVLEKSDTAAMFQRDAHALENALKDAGLQTDGSSLSFELSQEGNAFKQSMQQDSQGAKSMSASTQASIEEISGIEASLDIFTDNKTGLTHYNLRV